MKSKLQLYPYDKPVYEWHKEELEPTFGEYYKVCQTIPFDNNAYYGTKPNTGDDFNDPVFLHKYHNTCDYSEFNVKDYEEKTTYKVDKKMRMIKLTFPDYYSYRFFEPNDESYKELDNYTDLGIFQMVPVSHNGYLYNLYKQSKYTLNKNVRLYKNFYNKFQVFNLESAGAIKKIQSNITGNISLMDVKVEDDYLQGYVLSNGNYATGVSSIDYDGAQRYHEYYDDRHYIDWYPQVSGIYYPMVEIPYEDLRKYIVEDKSYNVNTSTAEWGIKERIDNEYKIFERDDTAGINNWINGYEYEELTAKEYEEQSGDVVVDKDVIYWTYDNPNQYVEEMPTPLDLSKAAIWYGRLDISTHHYLVDFDNFQNKVVPFRHDTYGEDGVYYKHIYEDTNFKYLDNDMVLSANGMLNTRYVHKYKTRTAPIDKGYIQDYVIGHEEDGIWIYETIKDYFTKDKYELVLNRYIGRSLIGGYIPKDSRSWYNEDGTPYDWKELDLIAANNFRYPIYSNAYNDIQILNNPDKLPNGATLNTNYAIAIFGDEIWGYRPIDDNLPIAWEKPTLYDNDLITPTSMNFGWEKLFDIITEREDDTHYHYLLKEYFDIKEISTMGVKWRKCYAIPTDEWEDTYFTWLGNTYNPTSETTGLCLMYENPADYGYEIGHYDIVNIEKIYNANKYYLPHTEVYDGFTRTTYHGTALYIDGTFAILPEDMLGPLTYHKTVNDGDSLDFTTVSSASIDVELNYRVEEANKLIGSNFTYLLDYGDGKWRPMGLFTIDEVENIDNYSSRITGHDHIYRLNKYVDNFIEAYNYPTTIGKFWHDLCGYCGLIYDEAEDLGEIANIPLKRNFQAVKTTGLQLAEFVAQLFGSFIHIDKDNYEAKISHYRNTDFTLQLRNYKDITYTYYNAQMPNQIRLGFNNDKNIIVSAQVRPDEVEVPYYLMDNALITYNITDEDSQKLVNELCKVLTDLPTDIKRIELSMNTPGDNVDIKVGDILEVQTKLDEVIRMMVMEISIDGSGITYKSFGEMNYPVKGDSITSQIIYLEDTRRELNNVINDMGYVAEDLININEKFTEVDNSIAALDGDIAASNERIDNLGEAVNSTSQSVVELGNIMKEFKSTADLDEGLATIDLTNQLTGVVLDSRLQAQTLALLEVINNKSSIVYMTHDTNSSIPENGYILTIGKNDLYISIANYDLSKSNTSISTVYLYLFIIMNNQIISKGRFNAL